MAIRHAKLTTQTPFSVCFLGPAVCCCLSCGLGEHSGLEVSGLRTTMIQAHEQQRIHKTYSAMNAHAQLLMRMHIHILHIFTYYRQASHIGTHTFASQHAASKTITADPRSSASGLKGCFVCCSLPPSISFFQTKCFMCLHPQTPRLSPSFNKCSTTPTAPIPSPTYFLWGW